MTFVQWEFLVFFAVVYTLYWGVPIRRVQNVLLAVSSCVFYGWVHPWFLILLFTSSILDFVAATLIEDRPGHRRLWLALSMAGNLGMLGYFKYCDFFLENVAAVLDALGIPNDVHTLGVFLPVGISFYTFQTMSYTIDVYRGDLKACRSPIDYIVFVTFFPQLVAGPVERAANLLRRVQQDRVFSWSRQQDGFALAMWGAFKKVCVADLISPYVDRVFVLQEPSLALVALATVGFSLQILADFSGYTDIARGVSRMMGFELIKNFDHPYMAVDPSDFWRRWHISFSSWIRDYVYIAVGGSRGSFWFSTRNSYIAMLTSGLWHGASWNFVLWGGYHATLLTAYRLLKPLVPAAIRASRLAGPASIGLMYALTCYGWLLFRETHLDRLVYYHTSLSVLGTPDQRVAALVLAVTVAMVAAPLALALWAERAVRPRLEGTPWLLAAQTTLWAVYSVLIVSLVRTGDNDFIYFQF
ncbi:MAG TPA: MBOAT family O-acyltransferase [Myxococcota bacterium]|nr:MBOAT family O-acyltransferase [Myxococcota bacterium]